MKLWIPMCGDAAIIDEDWRFTLHDEYRNADFARKVTGKERVGRDRYRGNGPVEVQLGAGTELVFDRVYTRQNNDEFASVTFVIKLSPIEKFIGERFWVKLEDANQMRLTPTTCGNPVGGFAKAAYKAALAEAKDPSLVVAKHARKVAKEELESIREYVRERCSGLASEPLSPHVDTIIMNVRCARRAKYSHHAGLPIRGEDQATRSDMQHGPWRAKDSDPWVVVKTTKQADGTTLREFRFTWEGQKFGGFTVVSKGTQVVSCEALT